jgi:hypothetical protein
MVHWSGCVRPVDAARRAAGLNALRGSGPNLAFEDALTLAGSPDPRNDRVCITSLCPRQFLVTSACARARLGSAAMLRSFTQPS